MTISLLGYCFLFIVCIFWPLRSYLALRKHPIGQAITASKQRRYIFGLLLTLLQTGFAWWVSIDNRIHLWGSSQIHLSGILVAALFLAITLGTLPWLVKHRSPGWRMRFYSILPTTGSEQTAWVLICVIVAVGEEIIYRAVLFGLFYRLTENFWISAGIAAAVFAFNHLVQGWISAGTVFIIGFGFHLLVLFTGGLYASIATHFIYDLLAGLYYGRKVQKELGLSEENMLSRGFSAADFHGNLRIRADQDGSNTLGS